jgi:hypothetical protein
MGQPVPSNYLELEKLLVAQGKERMPPIMSWDEFRSLARLCLIEREHDLLAATSLLHNFGSLVHFPNDEKVRACPSLRGCCKCSGADVWVGAAQGRGHPGAPMADERHVHRRVDEAQLLQVRHADFFASRTAPC